MSQPGTFRRSYHRWRWEAELRALWLVACDYCVDIERAVDRPGYVVTATPWRTT